MAVTDINRPAKKLQAKFIGPFPMAQVLSPVSLQLTLSQNMHVNPVFHTSILRKYIPNDFSDCYQVPPPSVVIHG